MNRRELVTWTLMMPFASSAKTTGLAASTIRIFADLKHTGHLTGPINTPTITDADFGIAAPLPTILSEQDFLPASDPQEQDITSRLGLLLIETPKAHTRLVVSVLGEETDALHLYRKEPNGWRRLVSSTPTKWLLETDQQGKVEIGIGVVLPVATETAKTPVWPRTFNVEIDSIHTQPQQIPFRVAPFIIPCALDTAQEVLIVSNTDTTDSVKDLEAWGRRLTNITVSILEAQEPCDQWMQDTMEPGVFAFPGADGVMQARGIMSGQRSEFGARAAGLDHQIAKHLGEQGQVIVHQSVPRKATRWIDWFGNLEVSPPHTDSQGRRFPYGRIIIGRQHELMMHPDALRFLEAQGMQWPPIVLDTSWSMIGHADEVVNFVPAQTAVGYKVLLPSPLAANNMLDALLKHSLGHLPVFADTPDETTIAKLRNDIGTSKENADIDATISNIRNQLQHELNIHESDFVMLPCLFKQGSAVIPNTVNCLSVNGHLVAMQPKGPNNNGKDLFEEAIRTALAPCQVDITFIDGWHAYHRWAGEVHCGTNSFRRLKDAAWWKHMGNHILT